MANDLNRSIKIFIDGTPAAQGIAPVEAAIQKLEAKLSALNKSEADYEEKSKKLKKELASKNRTLENYKKQVEETNRVLKDLSGATYNELIAVQSKVRKQLREAAPGTEKYNAALEQNRRVAEAVTKAQKAMRVEVGCQGTAWGKAVGLFNKYAAVVTTGIAAITGVTLKLNQLREKRNQREEAKADVKALTGLDNESINWLEQEAKKLSTAMDESGIRIRQSATEILDAYKLVSSAKPELLNDKEALAEVTKQTLILASASGMTLKDAVDAVTLSLNQYGDGADQAARYANVMAAGSKYGAAAVESVTTAVTKSGVAASSANIPIEQLVGTIETLAEKGIKDEIAGTGLKKFFLTLQTGADETNPKIVGLETALDNLQKKQLSAAQIKKMFGEEGYNVASVLINEAEKVKYYTQAVTGSTVAVEQAATKSSTAAAKLDQAKNKMNEMGISLMEKLNPAIVSSVNGIVNWGRKFITLIDFIVRNSGVIVTLTTTIISYYTATKVAALYEIQLKDAKLSHIAVEKLSAYWHKITLASTLALSAAKYALTGNINMAATAIKRLNTVMKGNLFGIVISLVATLGVGLHQLLTRTSATSDAMQRMNGEMLNEQRSLDSLFDTLKRTNPGSEERKKIIQEINDKYGQYLPNLLTEKSSLDEINSAYQRINASITEQIALKYKNEEISELTNKAAKKQIDTIEELRVSFIQSLGNNKLATMAIDDLKRITTEFYNAGSSWDKAFGQAYHTIKAKYFGKKSLGNGVSSDMETYIKSWYGMQHDIAKVENKYANWMPKKKENELNEVVITANKSKPTDTVTLSEEESEKHRKAHFEKLKTTYIQEQAELTKIYASGNDERLRTEEQYNDQLLELKKSYLNKVIAAAGAGTKEAADAEKQLSDIQLQERKASVQKALDKEKESYAQQKHDLQEAYANGSDKNINDYETFQEALEQLLIVHLQRTLKIAGLDADTRKQIEEQLFAFKIKCLKEEEEAQKKSEADKLKNTENNNKKQQEAYQKRVKTYQQYGNQIGSALGAVIAGQENAIQGFADTMIDIVFDVLRQIIEAEIIKTTATATGAVGRATAESMATPDSVLTFGASGATRAAVLTGLIMAALSTAKMALKGLISKKSDSSLSSSNSEQSTGERIAVPQHASGKYDVIGKEDNRTYHDIPYIGEAPTSIVRRPALISENGAELIVNADDLQRLQRHVNYPLVLQAINESRHPAPSVSQHAAGNYPIENMPATNAHLQNSFGTNGLSSDLMNRLANAIIRLDEEGFPPSTVLLSELERKQKLRDRSRKIGSK